MRRIPAILTVLFCALLVTPPLLARHVTRTLRVELSPGTTGPFAVENLAGTMRVVPGSGDMVVAIATVHAEDDELADSVRFEQVSGKGGRPTLRVRYPLDDLGTIHYPGDRRGASSFLNWFGGSNTRTKYDGYRVKISSSRGTMVYADVEVQVPSESIDATFRNVVGLVRAAGVDGTLRFETGSGDVKVEEVRGEVRADTGSGDVDISDIQGSVRGDTGSGDIDVRNVDGDWAICKVGSGDVTIRSATLTRVEVGTGSGDVRVVDVDIVEFSADTGSGDVVLQNYGDRLVRVTSDTGSGDVTLRLSPDATFEAYADQGSGDLVSRYSEAQAIVRGREVVGYRRGDGRIRIDVETGSGDLVIEPGRSSARR